MSVREYIGARYVPVFADPLEWDGTKAYEPLTVVYNQGNSYTSRQAVPAGIEITNSVYWALTGNYSAQVEQYRQEVAAFDGRITANAQAIADEVTARMAADAALQASIDAYDSRITANATAIADEATARATADTALQSDITANATAIADEATARAAADTAMQADIAVNAGAIDALKTTLPNLVYSGYNMVMIGDSFAAGTGASTEANRFPNIIASTLNMTLFNYAVGGAGFWDEHGNNDAFPHQIAKAISEMSSAEIANTRLVCINGGYNDYMEYEAGTVSRNTVLDSVIATIQAARTGFPNAKIYVAPMNWACYEFNTIARIWYDEMARVISECHIQGVALIENCPYWLLGRLSCYNGGSNVHPNDEGYSRYAGHFVNAITGGGQEYAFSQSYSYQNAEFGSRFIEDINGMVHLNINTLTFDALASDAVIAVIPDRHIPQTMICLPVTWNFNHFGIIRVRTDGQVTFNRGNDASQAYPLTGTAYVAPGSWPLYAKKSHQDG